MPLRYPMSVRWSGSDNLAIGTDVAAAKAAGKAAILDPATRKLTALKSGDVTVTVTVDSMREYTGADSLAPITTSKVIRTQVTSVDEQAPIGGSVPATLVAHPRRPGLLRRVHAGRDQDLRGLHHRDRGLHGRRRDPHGG